MMNAELVAGGEERIIIPTAYRTDYLGALKALSHNTATAPLLRLMDYAQRYTHALDWRTLDAARALLDQTGAFGQGELARLRLPAGAGAGMLLNVSLLSRQRPGPRCRNRLGRPCGRSPACRLRPRPSTPL